MANDLTKPAPNPFEAYAAAATNSHIVGKLLKFSKGDYLAGQDSEDIPTGTEMVALMDSLMVGFTRWENNAPAEQIMGRVIDGYVPPRRSELGYTDQSEWETDERGDPRDPFQLTNYLILIDPKALDEPYTFTTSSKGGMGAIGELCKVYGRHMREHPDQCPVIKLEVGSYNHRDKSLGRIKYPSFPVLRWVDKAPYVKALEGGTNGAAEAAPTQPAQEPTPAAKKKKPGEPVF
jgi:hypothetical protein